MKQKIIIGALFLTGLITHDVYTLDWFKKNVVKPVSKGLKNAAKTVEDTGDAAVQTVKTGVEDTAKKIEKGSEQAIQTVGTGLTTAANAVADRFKDTQATRAIDYAARKAALESSLAIAKGTLD